MRDLQDVFVDSISSIEGLHDSFANEYFGFLCNRFSEYTNALSDLEERIEQRLYNELYDILSSARDMSDLHLYDTFRGSL